MKVATTKTCSIKGCGGVYYAKEFCSSHYNRSEAVKQANRNRWATESGKKRMHQKNVKYGSTFRGQMNRRFKGKNLSEIEKKIAESAFKTFDGKCYCCGTTDPGVKGWVLDHKEDKFRGILCVWCNCAAGFLRDNTEQCQKLIEYLEKDRDRKDVVTLSKAAELGKGVLAHINHYVREAVKQAQIGKLRVPWQEGGATLREHKVAVLNVPYLNCSEVGNELAKTADFGMTWFERGDGITQFSLRSIGDFDVCEIAKKYSGGGHKNAAGFQMSYERARLLIDVILGRSSYAFEPGTCVR